MTVDGRALVLSAIAEALGQGGDILAEPAPFVIATAGEDRTMMARKFGVELKAVGGAAIIVSDAAEGATAIATYLRERNVRRIAVQSSGKLDGISTRLQADFSVAPAVGRTKHELALVDCGLLDGRALLADTGSAVVVLDNGEDRALPYLPRTCVIVSDMASLHPTLTGDAMQCIYDAARAGTNGEALIITGPSRTADIEKTLVLGAHGPQAVAVFIVM